MAVTEGINQAPNQYQDAYWDSLKKRLEQVIGHEKYAKVQVSVPIIDLSYMVGFDFLDDYEKGKCVIEAQPTAEGYVLSIGDTTLQGEPKKVKLPTFSGTVMPSDSRLFDKFVIEGDSRGFSMIGISDGRVEAIAPIGKFDPASNLFATCIFALEQHKIHAAKSLNK